MVSEACFILRRVPEGPQKVLELFGRGLIDSSFRLRDEHAAIQVLMRRYADLPVSFADACLLRMAELTPDSRVMTCDRHFLVYRILGRRVVPSITPDL